MTRSGLDRINTAPKSEARTALHAICAAREWQDALLSRRPYPDTDALCAAGDEATARLTDDGLDRALSAHPPIGRPDPDDPVSGREQRGMSGAGPGLKADMLDANLAYQEKFGHVFLICASGLTGAQMLAAARERLHHTPQQERETVRRELARIHRIRLEQLARAAPEKESGPA